MSYSEVIIKESISDLEIIIKESISTLEDAQLQLTGIDEEELDTENKSNLANELNEIALNLIRLRNAQIAALTDEFKAKQYDLMKCTAGLRSDLEKLQDDIDKIKAVAKTIGPITKIVQLIA